MQWLRKRRAVRRERELQKHSKTSVTSVHILHFKSYEIHIVRKQHEGGEAYYGFEIFEGRVEIASEAEKYRTTTSAAVGAFTWIDRMEDQLRNDDELFPFEKENLA